MVPLWPERVVTDPPQVRARRTGHREGQAGNKKAKVMGSKVGPQEINLEEINTAGLLGARLPKCALV